MRAPLLLDLPHARRRSQDSGDVAASAAPEHEDTHNQPRLALYVSSHGHRPRFVGPAPKLTWRERVRDRLHQMLGKETTP
jgi:hypothetical protein